MNKRFIASVDLHITEDGRILFGTDKVSVAYLIKAHIPEFVIEEDKEEETFFVGDE